MRKNCYSVGIQEERAVVSCVAADIGSADKCNLCSSRRSICENRVLGLYRWMGPLCAKETRQECAETVWNALHSELTWMGCDGLKLLWRTVTHVDLYIQVLCQNLLLHVFPSIQQWPKLPVKPLLSIKFYNVCLQSTAGVLTWRNSLQSLLKYSAPNWVHCENLHYVS
jgi:hypothetical protein